MKSIEFYDLPRPIQERFVASAQSTLAPAPLAVKLASRFVGARWFVSSLAVLTLTAWYAARGFGDLWHAGALANAREALVYCAGFALSFACLTRGLMLRDRASSLPFARATYLFPAGVIDAVSSSLSVHPLSELRAVEATEAALRVTFNDGASFEFPAPDPSQAERAKAAVSQSRQLLDAATRADSVRSLAALDPLCETNFPSPFSEDVPFRRPTALWGLALLGMALLSGSALGVGVWQVRNRASEQQIAETARSLNTTAAYREYIARGGDEPEVVDLLLPRAELAEARAEGTVGAIERFVASHPDTQIRAEVDAALESALLEALGRARAEGTLAALDRFVGAHPSHAPVAPALAEARHAVYRAAAEGARARVTPGRVQHSHPAEFIDRLIAHVERHGPRVEVRFRSWLGKSCESADDQVRRSRYFGGNSSLPSRYFGSEHSSRREALVSPPLLAALQSLFPPEIVRFELGERLPSPEPGERPGSLPAPEVPTLFIDHRTELSGSHTIAKPRGIFFGAGVFFETSWVIPGEKSSLDISVPTWRAPARSVMLHERRTTADVYEDLARRSFGMFSRRFLDRLLREAPPISVPDIELEPEDDPGRG